MGACLDPAPDHRQAVAHWARSLTSPAALPRRRAAPSRPTSGCPRALLPSRPQLGLGSYPRRRGNAAMPRAHAPRHEAVRRNRSAREPKAVAPATCDPAAAASCCGELLLHHLHQAPPHWAEPPQATTLPLPLARMKMSAWSPAQPATCQLPHAQQIVTQPAGRVDAEDEQKQQPSRYQLAA